MRADPLDYVVGMATGLDYIYAAQDLQEWARPDDSTTIRQADVGALDADDWVPAGGMKQLSIANGKYRLSTPAIARR